MKPLTEHEKATMRAMVKALSRPETREKSRVQSLATVALAHAKRVKAAKAVAFKR